MASLLGAGLRPAPFFCAFFSSVVVYTVVVYIAGNTAMATLSYIWMLLAVATYVVLLRLPAPYGRHRKPGWGPTIPHRVGWVIMESMSPLAFFVSYELSGGKAFTYATMLMVLWCLHYTNRALIHPFRARWSGRRMPVIIALAAVGFNSVNGALNGWYMGHLSWTPPVAIVVLGGLLFVGGAAINIWADEVLRRLRPPGTSEYHIPRGGLYKYVSCPNYTGEILEWTGFALMASTPAAWAFAIWTAANLIPRAMSHHSWYKETFPAYPEDRKAVVPFIL